MRRTLGGAVDDVTFRLLGSFEVAKDQRIVGVGGAAERKLLALLLLSPGRTVAATSLMDRLWSEDTLPADPHNALHLRVSKLRRALRASGIAMVVRDGAGYRADVDPAAIDVEVFVRSIRMGRAAGGGGSLSKLEALSRYDEALALWRGDPFADFSTQPWATVEAARLSQMHIAALTERAQLALDLGRHAEVIGDLGPVVAQDPKLETAVGLLMTALYRGGRQADALEVFTRTRDVLDDELGLEPSAALRSLHQRILRQDDGLAGPPERVDAPTAGVGANQEGQGAGASVNGGGPDSSGRDFAVAWRRLIGREEELRSLAGLIGTSRVVTLVGPGGAGKTVLAVALSAEVGDRYADGVRVIRLAPVVEGAQVPLAVAEALGVPLDGAAESQARARVLSFLEGRDLLLVVDNAEHVVDAVARLVDEIMTGCPRVTVVTTSREALAVPGEVQVAVGPLAAPPDGTAPDRILDYPAAQLFVERGRAVRPGLTLDDTDLTEIGRVVATLDGMPLAVELAAARLSTLSPTELAERLVDRFGLLTGGPRTAEARQRTLRATVDWSHALLSGPERVVFRRLAGFHGGWTLGAAEAVVSGPPPEDDGSTGHPVMGRDVLDILGRLVERSMVLAETGHPTRFRMLETLRQYAAERLDESGEVDIVAQRHAEYFRDLASLAEASLRGSGQRQTLRLLRDDQANLRSALKWLSADPSRQEGALVLAGALGWFWHLGRHLEGREVLRRLLAHPGGSPAARARALLAVSLVERPRACLVHPNPHCAEAARESLALFLETGDQHRAALARVLLAVEGVADPDSRESAALLAEAETWFTAQEDAWGHAVIAFVRMETYLKSGEEAQARATGRAAAAAFRALGDLWGLSAVLYHLGWGLRQFGRYSEAVPVLEDAVEVAESAGLHNTVQWALGDLGIALLHLGDYGAAAQAFVRAADASAAIGDGAGKVLELYGRGLLARVRGDWTAAADLFTEAHNGFVTLGTPVAAAYALAGRGRCDEHRADALSAARAYDEVLAIGTTAGEPGLRALALEGMARLALERDPPAATRFAREAAAIRGAWVRPASPQEREDRAVLADLT